MKQVAALAGVGIKTVSRVINREPNVAEATAARVWAAIQTLDYHVDLQAGSLRRSGARSRTLGLLVGSVDNPFAGAIHRSVEDVAIRREVAVFASSLDDDPEREEEAVRAFLRRRVDGLILTTAQHSQGYSRSLKELGIPVVYVDRAPADSSFDFVSSDNRGGSREATLHLIAHGHRRIALLADRLDIQTASERRQGFLEAIGEAGIPTAFTSIVTELHDTEDAERELAKLLRSAEPPTAILSAQNLITVGAVHALRAAGAQHSIALVGFDDLPLADLLDPGITVMAQDPHMIGTIAAERVFARMDGDESAPLRSLLPAHMIQRGSGEIPGPFA